MKAQYLEAAARMTTSSELFSRREPYMFGISSMWYLFYRPLGSEVAGAVPVPGGAAGKQIRGPPDEKARTTR